MGHHDIITYRVEPRPDGGYVVIARHWLPRAARWRAIIGKKAVPEYEDHVVAIIQGDVPNEQFYG